jgi:hypothetical protein
VIPSAIQSRPVPDAAPTIPGDDAAGRHAPPAPTPVSPARRLAPRLFGEAYWLAPVLVLLAVASPHLDQGGFRSDTGRYAAVGLQAWREGNLLDLHLQEGVPYQNKPPLALWVHGLMLHTLGVSVWAARLPVVLVAAGSVALVARIGARLGGRPAGFLSGLVFALTYEYFRRVREISLDVWQTFFMLAAVWLVIRATTGRPRTRMALAGACIGLALMVKPLVGLVVLPFMGLWLALTGRSRRLPSLLWALFAAGVVASPWHVAMALRQGDAFTGQYFGAEVVGRAIGEIQTLPPWYYLDILLRTYWPWNLVLMLGAWGWWKRRTRDQAQGAASNDPANDPPGRELVLLGLLWGAGWLGLISLFPDKYPALRDPSLCGSGVGRGRGSCAASGAPAPRADAAPRAVAAHRRAGHRSGALDAADPLAGRARAGARRAPPVDRHAAPRKRLGLEALQQRSRRPVPRPWLVAQGRRGRRDLPRSGWGHGHHTPALRRHADPAGR